MIDITTEAIKYRNSLLNTLYDVMDGKASKFSNWSLGGIAEHIKFCDKIIDRENVDRKYVLKLFSKLDPNNRDDLPKKFIAYITPDDAL